VGAHYGRIYATAFHLLGNHEDAEDLTQECFVRAHRSLGWFRGEGSFEGWLRTIVVHLALDRRRSHGRRPASEAESVLEGLSGARDPEREAGRREMKHLLDAALARLPDRLRVPLVLRVLDGLEYDDVARATGVTPSTARNQVMLARKALMRFLAPYFERSGE
jgi:RNA polymerase sigma-70 factor (ECF subfamily)